MPGWQVEQGKVQMRTVIVMAIMATLLAACQTPVPVDRPCGVIRDSLASVTATTRAGQQRLDIHHERGRRAGCW